VENKALFAVFYAQGPKLLQKPALDLPHFNLICFSSTW